MPDWTALRRRARVQQQRLCALLPADTPPLPTADALLDAAESETGLSRVPVPPGDSLLAGAHAVLDREAETIWYAQEAGSAPEWQRFAQAHEFGHYWLHPGACQCEVDDAPDSLLTDSLPSALQIAQGYSPKERRETEADLFAAELLLPAPALRRAWIEHGWSTARIAAHVGVGESWVLAQLRESLLLPDQAEKTRPNISLLPSEERTMKGEGQGDEGELSEGRGLQGGKGEAAPPSSFGSGLNASQRAAAEIERGPVLVDAGPGTGKTHTLVARVLTLLQECNVAPENILALTFSNKAAEEMRTRLAAAAPDEADRLWIGTFHAFGMEMLRKEGRALGLPLTPGLLELTDAVVLLERSLDRLPLNEFANLSDPALPFPAILRCISRAKDELKTPEDYHAAAARQYAAAQNEEERLAALKSAEVAQIYAVYQRLLAENGLLDFGDLLMRPVELLDAFPDVRARWQAQFPHILADEYQDINRASAQLVQRLAGDGSGLWAVGDLRQAIYRFRGASPANVREFEQDFPGGRRLQLDVNYRSRPALVSLFSAAAAQMPVSSEVTKQATDVTAFREWQAHRSDANTPCLTLAVAANEEAQADGLAAQIRAQEAAGVPLRDQAILCRTNGQATDLSAKLEARGIPTLHLGDLFDRPEVKDMLSLLALACEPSGRELARVVQFAEYAVPADDVICLLDAARQEKRAFPSALALAADLPGLSAAGRQGLLRLWGHLEPLIYRGDAWMLLARYLFDGSDYLRPLLADDTISNRQKRLALYQLLAFAQGCAHKFAQLAEESKHKALLDHIRRLRACNEDHIRLPAAAEELDGVRLMTVHASKGLEFPVVCLPNLVKGQFPPRGQGAMATPPPTLLAEGESGIGTPSEEAADADAEGETCLFFVALSRARDHLLLCRPETWRGKAVVPSPLLAWIEPALAAKGAEQIRWESSSEASTEEPPKDEALSEEKPDVTLSALELYQRCPRQYYYQRVAKLPAHDADSAYLVFHTCLQEVTRWLRAEQAAGGRPTLEEQMTQFDKLWAERAPEEGFGAQAHLLRNHAEAMLRSMPDMPPAPSAKSAPIQRDLELTADLPNGRVRFSCDHAEHLPDGTLRLGRYLKGRTRKDDHTAPRLALMRHAARQQDPERPVEIMLYYLNDGQQRDVPEKARYEPARVAKYDEALRGIRAGEFPPAPEDRKCTQCPYFFLCPA
jgi:superfamily I DNA/RNA helicase/Zn-dependent peptidase ImmA (M78 family)